MKKIPLTRGQFALVDDADFDGLSKHKWYALIAKKGNFIATRWINGKNQSMHRIIMDAPKGMCVDHKNHSTLDNRRSNLRICTHSQNSANRLIDSRNNSGYKGVYWCKEKKKWQSKIVFKRNRVYLGSFKNKKVAARAYNAAALRLFGEFALLNKV